MEHSIDREKVIEALENADLTDGVVKMSTQFRDIVVDLLKEQETKFICNLLGGQPYEVYCRECRTIVCQLSKGDTMDTVKRIFSFCPHCGRLVKWE